MYAKRPGATLGAVCEVPSVFTPLLVPRGDPSDRGVC